MLEAAVLSGAMSGRVTPPDLATRYEKRSQLSGDGGHCCSSHLARLVVIRQTRPSTTAALVAFAGGA